MSEETEEKDGVQTTQDGVESGDEKVAYSSFQRAVDEAKKAKKEAEALRQEVDSWKSKELEKEGDLKQALDTWKERYKNLESENKEIKTSFATTQINSKIKTALGKRGCLNPDDALNCMDDRDYQALVADVDSDFNISEQTLGLVLDKFQKDRSYFFGKKAPVIADGVPAREAGKEKPEDAKQRALRKIKEAKTPEEFKKAKEEAYKLF